MISKVSKQNFHTFVFANNVKVFRLKETLNYIKHVKQIINKQYSSTRHMKYNIRKRNMHIMIFNV
jgi:hypothetical protein